MTDAPPRPLHRFHGGLHLPGKKSGTPIRPCPLPTHLHVSLELYGDVLAEPGIDVGVRVQRGQCIATAPGVEVHAPASGTVIGISTSPRASIHIACDALQGPALTLPPLNPWHATIDELRNRLRHAGIVGLGGAGFPTAEKLAGGASLLILNGAECEPYIACDDALLRQRAEDVVLGGRLLARLAGAATTLLAIEESMPEAYAACALAITTSGKGQVELVGVPTVYPEGGERQLIEVLTGRQVPRGGLPRDIGVIVQNVGTAAAAWRAVTQGETLGSRIVSVAGGGVAEPGNFEVAFGTPVSHLVAQAGGYTPQAARLLLGGPMMGRAMPDDDCVVDKTTNCVLVLAAGDIRDPAAEMPCIRCGDCASACPARLQPQQLLWHIRADNQVRAEADGVFDCIECGCCDLACPSHIPLTEHFRNAKTAIRIEQRRMAVAAAAGLRFQHRGERLQRLGTERAEREAARAQSASSGDAVAAAIERAKARRQQGKDAPP